MNAYILNLKGPKKVGQGPKFGPGAHGLDSPGIQEAGALVSTCAVSNEVRAEASGDRVPDVQTRVRAASEYYAA